MQAEHERIEDLLIALTTEHPDLAESLTEVRTYLRGLYGRAQHREALAILTRAVEGAAGEMDQMREVVRRAAAAQEEENALAARALAATANGRNRRWGALRTGWESVRAAAGSKPAVAFFTLAGVALAYALAHALGVSEHLPGGAP